MELRVAAQESMELIQCPIIPFSPRAASIETSSEKDEFFALKAGLRKVKMFTDYVSIKRAKKAYRDEGSSESRSSSKSEEGEYTYHSFELEEFEGGSDQENEDDSAVRKTFSYGTLAHVNYAGISSARTNYENEDWVYYSNRRRSDVGSSSVQDLDSTINEQPLIQNTKRSILPWRKRKLSFRSPKSKGEPLLKKAYGEEGGDDIDYDRRQLSSDESLSFGWRSMIDEDSNANRSSVSEFGEDNFAVGTWEQKEITSRDGLMKIQTEVFFASIDQRNERAAGESACTALVAVLADWLQTNHNLMPIKSQFDSLIRDGSLEWRNLCENETYMQRFPDKHFDLETVLQAKIRNLCVASEKSFIGFFHPDGMEEGNFDFLHGAMSFENIWDEISQSEDNNTCEEEAQVFIVSWNDHFFVLKVDRDAYYIIDTLGERLHEGCSEAYILKFDKNTTIYKLPSKKDSNEDSKGTSVTEAEEPMEKESEDEVFCKGKETCKEYIKNFLAAIPIRELQADMKRGLLKSTQTPLHHRLQIEFHFTQLQQPTTITSIAIEEVVHV